MIGQENLLIRLKFGWSWHHENGTSVDSRLDAIFSGIIPPGDERKGGDARIVELVLGIRSSEFWDWSATRKGCQAAGLADALVTGYRLPSRKCRRRLRLFTQIGKLMDRIGKFFKSARPEMLIGG